MYIDPETNEIKYFGKYRAFVLNNQDPEKMRRIQVIAPLIDELEPLPWALPCDDGLKDWLPNVGDLVWVEFECGDVSYPIWVGRLMALADIDPKFLAEYSHFMKTERDYNGNHIEWSKIKGSPAATPAILINGNKRLATIDYVTWIKNSLMAWLKSHTHFGNSGVPTPLMPTDKVSLELLETDYVAKSAEGAEFMTNKLKAG